jgi:phosphoglycolate phosphatase
MKGPVLLFDLDGTLSDPSPGIVRCIIHTLTHFGRDVPPVPELQRLIGPPLHETFAQLVPDFAREAVTTFRDRYGVTGLFENDLYEGMIDALEELSEIAEAMYVATSKPADYAKRTIEHFELQRFFRAVYGSEMTGERADKRELLEHLIAEERLVPGNVIMIGDRKHDIAAARAHGMRSIGVTWGFGSIDELREAGADQLVDSPRDLVKAIS